MTELLEKNRSDLFSLNREGEAKTAYRRFFRGAEGQDVSFSGNNNTATNKYQVVVGTAGGQRTLSYDANGNCTNDGAGKTFEWDAANRMTAINNGTHRSEFVYDGRGRRVEITEKDSGVILSDKKFIWDGILIAEERDATGAITNKRFYRQDEQVTGSNYYYSKDHLGSVRELTDSNGVVVERLDYDSYGRRTLVSGMDLADFGFTGFYVHKSSGLNFPMRRTYDSDLARFTSHDPIEENGGLNLYEYCADNPVNKMDPFGYSP